MITLRTLIDGFLLYCRAESKSPETIIFYRQKLARVSRFLEQAAGDPVDAESITIQQLRQFLVHLQTEVWAYENTPRRSTSDRRLSPFTVQGYARSIKALFSWATREGHLETNPAALLKVPKAPKVIIPILSEAQIRQLFSVIDRRTSLGYRDYSLLLVFLDTGLRLSEVAGLELQHLHLEQGYLQVMGKGWKERQVPISARVQKALWTYLTKHRPEPAMPGIQNVFLTHHGQPLRPDTIHKIVSRCGKKAGIEGVRCSPHTFRHTFATNYLLNGGDVFTLQKILGHSSMEMVRIYVNMTAENVQAQHRRCSPVDTWRL